MWLTLLLIDASFEGGHVTMPQLDLRCTQDMHGVILIDVALYVACQQLPQRGA